MLEDKLAEIDRKIIKQSSLVKEMLSFSQKALTESKGELYSDLKEELEPEVNDLELEIDEACINLLALYNPEASDLRRVMAILKMNNDIERMGDLAVSICQRIRDIEDSHQIVTSKKLREMAEIVSDMLNDCIDAFIYSDSEKAKEVIKTDEEVDQLRKNVITDLVREMFENPNIIENTMQLINVANKLERMGDHATNISEDVYYMVKGKIIKHDLQNKI